MDEKPFQAVLAPHRRVLVVSGMLDELSVDELREAIRTGTNDYVDDLDINLTNVDFLPSIAIGVLVGAMKAGPAQLTLVVQKKCIARRVLEVSGLPHKVAS